MVLNTTSQYAIRAMTLIANSDKESLYNAKELSDTLNIPYKYLTKTMTKLVNANIIDSIRGREGGFALAKSPSEIKLIDILDALKDCVDEKNCLLGTGMCDAREKCILHDQWEHPRKEILNMFKNTTLENL